MRIRSIKPEFWRSDDVSDLAVEDRLLYIGLWSYVDDNGVGLDRLASIAADLFSGDLERDPQETFARVSRGLQHLETAGRITRYEADGKAYVHIGNWDKHQRVDRPNKSRYPLPTCGNMDPRDTLATPSREPRETPSPGTGEQGNRGTESAGSRSRPKRPLPNTWEPNDAHREQATKLGVDIDRETESFRTWSQSVDRRLVDWDAGFRNWLTKARPANGRPRQTEAPDAYIWEQRA